jgi:hypothetical protein
VFHAFAMEECIQDHTVQDIQVQASASIIDHSCSKWKPCNTFNVILENFGCTEGPNIGVLGADKAASC